MIAKYQERLAADSERRAADFGEAANITVGIIVDSANVIPQGKKIVMRKRKKPQSKCSNCGCPHPAGNSLSNRERIRAISNDP